MRLPLHIHSALPRLPASLRAACALAAGLAMFAAAPLSAQDEEGEEEDRPSFSLPTPTPSPTGEVQGPADERAGVLIGPRLIRPQQVRPAPANTPAPPAPQPSRTTRPQTEAPPVGTLFDDVLTQSETRQRKSPSQSTARATPAIVPEPGFSFEAAPAEDLPGDEDIPIDEEAWTDLAPGPSIDLEPPPLTSDTIAPATASMERSSPLGLWLAIACGLAALGLIGWMAWRSRKAPQLLLESNVASTAREQLAASIGTAGRRQPSSQAVPPLKPVEAREQPPRPPGAGIRIDLSFDIVSATRSVMKFALQYRLTVANRNDEAVRELSVMGELTSAVRGAANAPSPGKSQPIGTIERIGPQQSHTITGMLELPMVDVRMLRQGSTPVFIPLLHLTINGKDYGPKTSSFVIGVPSTANRLKLHPVALDGAPGTIRGLRANLVKPRSVKEPA